MDNSLSDAARGGNVEALHGLLEANPRMLSGIDEQPVADTPLHVAARHGKAKFAVEVAVFQPSLTKKLNPKGLTPLHEALKARKWETARVLAQLDTDQIRVKGTGGKTPLHVAAEVAPPQLLAELLFICPASIKDVTANWETAVHRAVKKKNVEGLQVLIGWIVRIHSKHVLQWKNINGDTVLHLACHARSKQMVEMLVKYVNIDTRNFNNKTAKDMVGMDPRDDGIRSLFLKRKRKWQLWAWGCRICFPLIPLSTSVNSDVTLRDNYGNSQGIYGKMKRSMGFRPTIEGDQTSEKSRDVVLLVAILIATTTYQALLTPPGGYWQDNSTSSTDSTGSSGTNPTHRAGEMIISGLSRFNFVCWNSIAFCFSVAAIVVNVIQLKQATMLRFATYILLINYMIILFFTLIVQQDVNYSAGSVIRGVNQFKFHPELAVLFIAALVGAFYLTAGLTAHREFRRLMDTTDRNIRILVRQDQPADYDILESEDDDDDAAAFDDEPQHALQIDNQ